MSDETWYPLGIESDEEIAEYDALHEGVPDWMHTPLWSWIREELNEGSYVSPQLRISSTEEMAQVLQIPFKDLRTTDLSKYAKNWQLDTAITILQKYDDGLQVADYILAFFPNPNERKLNDLLTRSNSLWQVGKRDKRAGLIKRIPVGVKIGLDTVLRRAGRAGERLAKAWEELYGLSSNPGEAYSLAIKAVEDAAIPVVSPKNQKATLGTVLRQMEDQGDWQLPMFREDSRTPSTNVVLGMIRLLWQGQHDRHGGQPSAPGNVNTEEATVAVGLATTLVHWFDACLVKRQAESS